MTQNQFEAAMTQRQDEGGELSSISGSDGDDDDDDDEDNDNVGKNYDDIDDPKLRNTKGFVSVCDMWVSANKKKN